jgi:hypothetical protein
MFEGSLQWGGECCCCCCGGGGVGDQNELVDRDDGIEKRQRDNTMAFLYA